MSVDLPHFSSQILPDQVPVQAHSKSPAALLVQVPPFLHGLVGSHPFSSI